MHMQSLDAWDRIVAEARRNFGGAAVDYAIMMIGRSLAARTGAAPVSAP
jgi:hypothetical protein